MDPQGRERWRLEGYLSKDEFRVNLEMGLARVATMRKDFRDAEQRYESIVANHPDSDFVPEAIYWRGISRYMTAHDHASLEEVAKTLRSKYPDSIWALKALPWAR